MEKMLSFLEVEKMYLVRTVTMIYTGKLVGVNEQEFLFEHVHWIAETERWNESVKNVSFREQEEYPVDRKVVIGRGALLDAVEIDKLPVGNK